jgi:hypothetical protein
VVGSRPLRTPSVQLGSPDGQPGPGQSGTSQVLRSSPAAQALVQLLSRHCWEAAQSAFVVQQPDPEQVPPAPAPLSPELSRPRTSFGSKSPRVKVQATDSSANPNKTRNRPVAGGLSWRRGRMVEPLTRVNNV